MEYLSDEWITAANEAIRDVEPADHPFAISYVVTNGEGERAHTLELTEPSITAGVSAPVALRMTVDVASAIARGELSAQRAFLDGDMRIDGDAQALVGYPDSLAAVDAALGELRAQTIY